jgi:transcription initiation factor TFIID subunit 13
MYPTAAFPFAPSINFSCGRTRSMFMSYSHYQPGQHPAGTTYPYYHPGAPGAYAHPQTPGYPAYHQGYATGVTGYGAWPYPYTYIPQQPPSQQAVRPTVQTAAPPAATPTPTPVAATPKTTTFTSYAPTYARETAPATTTSGGTGRSRKQANFKGLFSKERAFCRVFFIGRFSARFLQ